MPRTIVIPTTLNRHVLSALRAVHVDRPAEHPHSPAVPTRVFPIRSAYEVLDRERACIGIVVLPAATNWTTVGEWLAYRYGRLVPETRDRTKPHMSLADAARDLARRQHRALLDAARGARAPRNQMTLDL